MRVVRGDRVSAAPDVDAFALWIVARRRIDPPRWRRTAGLLLLPFISLNVVEPHFLAATSEKRLLLRGNVDERVAVAALRSDTSRPTAVPFTGRRIKGPRASIRRRFL